MPQRRQQTTWNRDMWGILNAHGKPWSPRTFGNETAAAEYLAAQAAQFPKGDLNNHTVARVSVTVLAPKHQQ